MYGNNFGMFIINSFIFSITSIMAWCKLLKTGQTTSYRTGDDGDLEAGRDVDFTTLDANNPFGNTNRFTDTLGGSTYANDWVIDWSTSDGSTVLGYYRVVQSAVQWNTAIDDSIANTYGTFNGCRLPNFKELNNVINFNLASRLDYTPFNISGSWEFWTSTTNPASTTAACNITSSFYSSRGKSSSTPTHIVIRTFTVTGTTLS